MPIYITQGALQPRGHVATNAVEAKGAFPVASDLALEIKSAGGA